MGAQDAGNSAQDGSPNTVGQAIAVSFRKQLLHLWANADPKSLSVSMVDAVVAALAPALVDSLINVANRLFPGLGVELATPLPAPEARPVGGGSGHEASNHSALLEELHSFLSSHNLLADEAEVRSFLKEEVSPKLPMNHPWQRWLCGGCALLLPADAVLSICSISAPALLARRWVSTPHAADDEDATATAGDPQDSAPAGSPQSAARALRCRKRVFALERELVAREHAQREREAFDKAERAKSEARLMDINRQLEERLKVKAEELRRAGQKIIEAQRGIDDARAQLTEKKHRISKLEYQIGLNKNSSEECEAKEKEYGRRMLRLAVQESALGEREHRRVLKLQGVLGAGSDLPASLLQAQDEMLNLDQSSGLFERLEAQFKERLQHRREQHNAALRQFEHHMEAKRAEYALICKQIEDSKTSPASKAGTASHSTPAVQAWSMKVTPPQLSPKSVSKAEKTVVAPQSSSEAPVSNRSANASSHASNSSSLELDVTEKLVEGDEEEEEEEEKEEEEGQEDEQRDAQARSGACSPLSEEGFGSSNGSDEED